MGEGVKMARRKEKHLRRELWFDSTLKASESWTEKLKVREIAGIEARLKSRMDQSKWTPKSLWYVNSSSLQEFQGRGFIQNRLC